MEPQPKINVGDPVPEFTLQDHNGKLVSMGNYLGRQQVVLFFYPKANTSGCTRESIEFTRNYEAFQAAGAEVFGVSADSPEDNSSFCEEHQLKTGGFLTDKDWRLLNSFGPRQMSDGSQVKRITFVIGKDGDLKLDYWFEGEGDVTDHVREALKAVKS